MSRFYLDFKTIVLLRREPGPLTEETALDAVSKAEEFVDEFRIR